MTQITLIKLGVIAIGVAAVPLSLAQTPQPELAEAIKPLPPSAQLRATLA